MAIKAVQEMQYSPIDYVGTYDEQTLDYSGLSSALDQANETAENQYERLATNLEGLGEIQDKLFNEKFHNSAQQQTFEALRHDIGITDQTIDSIDPSNPYALLGAKRQLGKLFQSPEYRQIRQEYEMADYAIEYFQENVDQFGDLAEDYAGKINEYLEETDPTNRQILGNELMGLVQEYKPTIDRKEDLKDLAESINSEISLNFKDVNDNVIISQLEKTSEERLSSAYENWLLNTSGANRRLMIKNGELEEKPTGEVVVTEKGRRQAEDFAENNRLRKETYKGMTSSDSSSSSSGGEVTDFSQIHPRDRVHSDPKPSNADTELKIMDTQLLSMGLTNQVLHDNYALVRETKEANPMIAIPLLLSQKPEITNPRVNSEVLKRFADVGQLKNPEKVKELIKGGYKVDFKGGNVLLSNGKEEVVVEKSTGGNFDSYEFFDKTNYHTEAAEQLGLSNKYSPHRGKSNVNIGSVRLDGPSDQEVYLHRNGQGIRVTEGNLVNSSEHSNKSNVKYIDIGTGETSTYNGTLNVGIDYVVDTPNKEYRPHFSGEVYEVNNDGNGGGYGNYVVVKSDNSVVIGGQEYDVYAQYSHNRRNLVEKGEKVSPTDDIAVMGKTGKVSGAHVDYSTFVVPKGQEPKRGVSNRTYVDPSQLHGQLNKKDNFSLSLGSLVKESESNSDYGSYYGVNDPNINPPSPERPIDDMKISEVYSFQSKLINKTKSSPVGAYQIIHTTLKEAVEDIPSIDENTLFTSEVQDKIFEHILMNKAGGNKYLNGDITLDEFYDKLTNEWVALEKNTYGSHLKNSIESMLDGSEENNTTTNTKQPASNIDKSKQEVDVKSPW